MSESRTYLDYLEDIATAMDSAMDFVQDMNVRSFKADLKTVYAVTRALEVMGEAAKRIPEAVRMRHPAIPWRLMAGMRDRLIHQYDVVDLDILWQTVTDDLPMVRAPLAALIHTERIAAGEIGE
ncbi:DUF86 domain-containing protein [Candidatus Oscillochloris fontis]|uniref:HepT-like ribonuclease domain-containing protein n=1 Tax=Candidatus Oscillochloris fontis TaxID=2496868 RepID=UPI00101C41CB|nr:DUF86 domain-containing protein [Candidatus Oscillochloris fontis]